MTHRVQRSYGHGLEGKADHLPGPAVCECFSHSPISGCCRMIQVCRCALSLSLSFLTLELEAFEVSKMFRPPYTYTCPGSLGFYLGWRVAHRNRVRMHYLECVTFGFTWSLLAFSLSDIREGSIHWPRRRTCTLSCECSCVECKGWKE